MAVVVRALEEVERARPGAGADALALTDAAGNRCMGLSLVYSLVYRVWFRRARSH